MSVNEKNKNFKVPDGYFDGIMSDMEMKISEDEIIQHFGKENPFVVPENYFENIEENLSQKKVKSILQAEKAVKPSGNTNKFIRIFVVAASVSIFMLISLLYINGNENKTKISSLKIDSTGINKKSNLEFNNFDDELLSQISEEDISTLFELDGILSEDGNVNNNPEEYKDFSYEEMEEYADEYIETEMILAEL